MNLANIDRVIEAIRNEDTFSMAFHVAPYESVIAVGDIPAQMIEARANKGCGTIACIAGWANILDNRPITDIDSIEQNAAEFMEIDNLPNATDLFYCEGTPITDVVLKPGAVSSEDMIFDRVVSRNLLGSWSLECVTSGEAIRALEILKETGKIDWDRAVMEVNGVTKYTIEGYDDE